MKKIYFFFVIIFYVSSIAFSQNISLVSETKISIFGHDEHELNFLFTYSGSFQRFYNTDVKDDTIICSTKAGIIVLDASNTDSVKTISIIPNPGDGIYNSLSIVDNMLYATPSNENKIILFDIKNLKNPEKFKEIVTNQPVFKIKKSGNYLILFETTPNWMSQFKVTTIEFLNIESPENPEIKNELTFSNYFIMDVDINDPYIYVCRNIFYDYKDNDGILEIHNISNPSEIINSISETFSDVKYSNIVLKDAYAYILTKFGEITVFDLSKSPEINIVNKINLDYSTSFLKIDDNKLYACGWDNIGIFDLNHSASPAHINNIARGNDYYSACSDVDFLPNKDALLLTFIVDGLVNFSKEPSEKPKPVFLHTQATDIAYFNNKIFISMGYGGAAFYSVENPFEPVKLSSFKTPVRARGTGVSGNIAFVCNDWGGMTLADVSNPLQPVTKIYNSQIWGVDFQNILIDGTMAFINVNEYGFYKIDISDPWNPKEVDLIDYKYIFGKLSLKKSFILPDGIGFGFIKYSVNADSNLVVTNMFNPDNPISTVCDNIKLKTLQNKNACLIDTLLFISDGDISVFNVKNPFNPELVSRIDTGGVTGRIAVNYPYIYTADIDYFRIYKYDETVSVEDKNLPEEINLGQNYPNPFNNSTTIHFFTSVRKDINLSIYSISGQMIRKLISGSTSQGNHSILWDGKDNRGIPVSSGIYFARLQSGNYENSKKILLLR